MAGEEAMRCRDVKKLVRLSKRLESENAYLKDCLKSMRHVEERRYPFNHLEIIVRPSREHHLIRYEILDLDLRVMGTDKMPTICAHKTIILSAFDLLRENEADFVKGVGELLASELMAHGKKV
jgi:hypothetical protein